MSGPQVDNSDERSAGGDGGAAEAEVVGDDDSSLTGCTVENLSVRSTNQPFLSSGAHVEAPGSQAFDNVRTDVLVDEKGKVEGLHAVILNSQVCSPFSASAAY